MCGSPVSGFYVIMKYTILINQYAAIKSGLDLDLIDLAIFDFIKDFSNSVNCIKTQTPEGIFFWISHKLVMEAIPLLNIKTAQGVAKRIDNLIKAGVIIKHPNCAQYSKTLYAFGKNYDLLTFAPGADAVITPPNESYTPQTKVIPPSNESLGVPPNESLGYNNNNDDNKNNNNPGILSPGSTNEGKPEKLRGTTEPRKCLFANSRFARFEDFQKCFQKPEYANIDIYYYYNSVADWSASKGRMQKDWIAQTRNFMRSDRERGKLKLLETPQERTTNNQEALNYLKDFE